MSQAGSPQLGDQPGMSIDTATGTEIERFHVVQFSTSTNSMQIGLCETSTSNRQLACGIAFRAWPYVPQVYATSGRPSTDISTYDSAKKQKLAVQKEGFTWFKVEIPSGGSDVSISPGDCLIPSTQQAGSVEPEEASALTASYASADILLDLNMRQRIIGKAYSVIHIPPSGASWPGYGGLDQGTKVATLTALTNAVTYGYVFGRLGKG